MLMLESTVREREGRGRKGGWGGGGGGSTLTSSRKDWADFYGCIK